MSNKYLGDFPTYEQMDKHNLILAQIANKLEGTATKNDVAKTLLALKKNGKKYGVHFDDFDINPSSEGTRLLDAVGMVCEPSTNIVHNRNDFEDIGPFAYLEVNGYVDADGDFQVTAIRGYDADFSRFTSDTWCLFPTHYIQTTINSSGEDIIISDTSFANSQPEAAAIRIDGSVRPFVPIAKYMASTVNGVPMSVAGQVATQHSHNSSITAFHGKGTQYCGQTMQDWEHLRTLFQVAFASRNSQSKMQGCSSYYVQYPATVTENNVERIIISTSNANNLVVGSCVSIGNATVLSGSNPNNDRGQAGMHAKANRKIITKIEKYDNSNSAVYVDNGGTKFSTASTTVSNVTCPTILSTMQWHTGACDNVLGACGSPNSNTSSKDPYILFGVELQLGYWEPCGNTIMRSENHLLQPYVCYDSTKLATDGGNYATNYTKLGYTIPDTNQTWKYISKLGYDANNPGIRLPVGISATSSNGYADGVYTNKLSELADGNFRAVLCAGDLSTGALCGLCVANLTNALSASAWTFASRLSASGRSGPKATA